MGDIPTRPTPLCRLYLVRAAATPTDRRAVLVGSADSQLSPDGRKAAEALRHHWEWADRVVSSPSPRALETARILAPQAPVEVMPELRPRHLGAFEGCAAESLRQTAPEAFALWQRGTPFDVDDAEPASTAISRAQAALESLSDGSAASVLVVSHLETIRLLAELVSVDLPAGRPLPGEGVLLTRRSDGHFAPGRASSDPEPLQSGLERTGLSGALRDEEPERHVGRLEIRCGQDA